MSPSRRFAGASVMLLLAGCGPGVIVTGKAWSFDGFVGIAFLAAFFIAIVMASLSYSAPRRKDRE